MAELQPTDQFLVNRSDLTQTVSQSSIMAELRDTDLLAVNRNDVVYKITGKDFKDSVKPDEQPPTVDGAALSGGPGFSGKTYTTTLQNYFPGVPAATLGMKAKVFGALSVAGETSPITEVRSSWNQSEVWSGAPSTGTNYPGYEWVNAFNGEKGDAAAGSGSDTTTIDLSGFSLTGQIALVFLYELAESHYCAVNGIELTASNTTKSRAGTSWRYLLTDITELNSIELNGSAQLESVEVSSQELVDSGIADTSAGSLLTLTDRTNLDNGAFVVGDVVTGYTQDAPASFAPVIYTGTSGNQDISCGFAPDFVWIKNRTTGNSHRLTDTVRGATKTLYSDTTNPEGIEANSLTAFTANGFTVGSENAVNKNGDDYVAWCWKASDTTVTNNDGSIITTVRAGNGFSIVKYNAAAANATLGHGLGSEPSFMVYKTLSSNANWRAYHKDLSSGHTLYLNTTDAELTDPDRVAAVSSTTFTLGSSVNSGEYVAYCFAETSGVSSIGSYTGNGSSASAPVIDCGFQPVFVLVKRADAADNWVIYDTARDPDLSCTKRLYPDQSNAEENNATHFVEILSNGFTPRSAGGGMLNADGGKYIYAAFAAGDPPVTVEDISTTADEMTVSGGDWQAGQTVKNSVVNPVSVKPVTDEIVGISVGAPGIPNIPNPSDSDVSDILAAAGVTAITGMGLLPRTDGYTSELSLFDADGSRISGFDAVTTEGTVYSNSNWQDFFNNTGNGRVQGENNTVYACSFPAYSILGKKISISIVTNDNSGGVYVLDQDGNKVTIVGDAAYSTLSFSGDKDLAQVEAADDVYQDAGYTAQTSEIVSIKSAINWDWKTKISDNMDSVDQSDVNYPERAFSDFTLSAYVSTPDPICWLPGLEDPSNYLYASEVWVGPNHFGADQLTVTVVTNASTYTSRVITKETTPYGEENLVKFTLNGREQIQKISVQNIASMDYNYLKTIWLDGQLIVEGENYGGTTLTLTDDSDLEIFRPNDVVQGGTADWNGPTTDTDSQQPDLADGAVIAYSATPQVFTLTPLVGGMGGQGYTSDDGVNWIYRGINPGNAGVPVMPASKWAAYGGSGRNARQISAANDFVWDNSWNTNIFDQQADCVADVAPDSVKVVSVGPGNKMTVDGGDWNDGNNNWNQDQVWSDAPMTGVDTASKSAGFNGNLSNGIDTNASGVTGNIDTSSWGFSDCKVELYAIQNANTTLRANGIDMPNDLSGGSAWSSIDITGPLASIEWVSSGSNYTLRAIKINGKLLVDQGIGGDTTVTCTYQPGTGIVSSVDVAGKTVTLSTIGNDYPLRWVANRGRKMTMDRKPAVKQTAFLEFTGTQVTGLTTSDPGYKPADSSLQLSFTDPAPSGDSWDTELPTGTTMQTRVFATNDSGSADSGWSNTVEGRKLPLDSTEEELRQAFLDSAAHIATFSNRAAVHQGELAQQQREEMRQKMAELGLTKSQCDHLIP